jgi:hypothetical protein
VVPPCEGFVSLKEKLRVLLACMTLEAAVIMGMPMRPEQIKELMQQMNQPKVAHVLRSEEEKGNDPPDQSD